MIEPVEMVMKTEENPDEEDIDELKLYYKDDDSESVYKEHVKIVKFMKKKPSLTCLITGFLYQTDRQVNGSKFVEG